MERRLTGFFCLVLFLSSWWPESVLPQDAASAPTAQSVRSITFKGHASFSRSALLSAITLREGVAFSQERLDHDIQTLTKLYRDDGFLFMMVDSTMVNARPSGEGVDIMVSIVEGKPAVVGSLVFRGGVKINERELRSEIASAVGSRFGQERVEQDVRLLLQRYEQAGYPFAKVSIEDIKLTEGEDRYVVDIVLGMDAGEPVTISELLVEGNSTTRTDLILREARLQPNEPFHPAAPARIQRRLQRTQLFSSVSLPTLFVREDGTAGYSVRVTEGSPNRFDGIVGYIPSTRTGESGYVTGLADVHFRNLFGTGRKLSARWQRENQTTQEIELRYHEPWLASLPVNAGAGFFQRKQDSAYVRRVYDFDADYMLTEEFRLGISVTQQDVVPSEGAGGLAVSESHTTTVGGFLYYDTRDDAVTPREGLLYRMDYHTGVKKQTLARSTATSSTQRFGLDFEYYLPVAVQQVAGAAIHAREFRAGGIELGDLYRLGGARTVRGYREGQFLGSRVAWANIEYRYLIAPRSFLYLFSDLAYLYHPGLATSGDTASEQTKIGYGAGLRLDTAIGLIGVSLAMGEGDTFSTAKLHVRLENEF